MSTDNTFTAYTTELAALLYYALGPSSHLATKVQGTGPSARFFFLFQTADPQECQDLKDELYSQEGGAQIANGLQLLRSMSAIRNTMRHATSSPDGAWVKFTPAAEGTE